MEGDKTRQDSSWAEHYENEDLRYDRCKDQNLPCVSVERRENEIYLLVVGEIVALDIVRLFAKNYEPMYLSHEASSHGFSRS